MAITSKVFLALLIAFLTGGKSLAMNAAYMCQEEPKNKPLDAGTFSLKCMAARVLAPLKWKDTEVPLELRPMLTAMKDPQEFLRFAIREDDPLMIRYALMQLKAEKNIGSKMGGCSALLYAVWHGKAQAVKTLIELGEDPNARMLGETALIYAVVRGHKDIVRILLHAGADIEATHIYPGMLAAPAPTTPEDRVIIELMGDDINRKELLKLMFYDDTPLSTKLAGLNAEAIRQYLHNYLRLQWMPEYTGTALECAVKAGNKEITELLVEKNADVNIPITFSGTLLHLAARRGFEEIVRLLLHKGMSPNIRNSSGETPLHWGHLKPAIAALLLDKGALIDAQDNQGRTPLHCVLQYYDYHDYYDYCYSYSELAELLIKRAGWTALHHAVEEGTISFIRKLIKHGANAYAPNNRGESAFTVAAELGNWAVLEELLAPGCWIQGLPDNGSGQYIFGPYIKKRIDTVLHALARKMSDTNLSRLASKYSKIQGKPVSAEDVVTHMLETCVRYGADISCKDGLGDTPLVVAIRVGHCGFIKGLIKAGAPIDIQELQAGFLEKVTIHEVVQIMNEEFIDICLQRLRDHIDLKNDQGFTPLQIVAKTGNTIFLKKLLDRGASINLQGSHGTALHVASTDAIFQELLARGASPHLTDQEGNTPLHCAVQKGFVESVKKLLAQGVPSNMRNNRGETALHLIATKINDNWSPHDYDLFKVLLAAESTSDRIKRWFGAKVGADTINNEGKSPLDLAKGYDWLLNSHGVRKGDATLTEIWLKRAVVPSLLALTLLALLSALENNLRNAAAAGNLETVKDILSLFPKIINSNLWKNDRTPLHYAAEAGHLEVVIVLLEHGADVEPGINSDGEIVSAWYIHTPLHLAARNNHPEIVKVLLEKGAHINVPTSPEKQTALHLAALGDHALMVKTLCEAGASISAMDSSRKTPRELAIEHQASAALHEFDRQDKPWDNKDNKDESTSFIPVTTAVFA